MCYSNAVRLFCELQHSAELVGTRCCSFACLSALWSSWYERFLNSSFKTQFQFWIKLFHTGAYACNFAKQFASSESLLERARFSRISNSEVKSLKSEVKNKVPPLREGVPLPARHPCHYLILILCVKHVFRLFSSQLPTLSACFNLLFRFCWSRKISHSNDVHFAVC